MAPRPTVRLVQLPIPQPAKGSATGNVPLAAGSLAAAVAAAEVDAEVDVLLPDETDALGDTRLVARLAEGEPACVGFSLYLWNVERSLDCARRLKEASPRTRIVFGGPEVAPDNPWVKAGDALDVAVTGEAEGLFPDLVARLLEGRDVSTMPGVATAAHREGTPSRTEETPLERLPSPYLAGTLPVDPRRATYLETVRGCRSHCTFCFYPRSSAVLRSLDVERSAAVVAALAERGAREVVFLDPTFNHRDGFEELLRALVRVNASRRLELFAEVRAEGLTAAHMDLLAEAGFTKLEIGLQSVNPRALARSKRGGRPERVAAAAQELRARGIEPIVDLIIGLPEDGPEDVLAGVEFLERHGLGDCAQVFPLSILPGTAMRASAASDGVRFDPYPPYHVIETRTMPAGAIADTLLRAEERLDRRLDEQPRPWLVEPHPPLDPKDLFTLDLDRADERARAAAAAPGAAHAALWLHGADLWRAREAVEAAIDARLAVDPHAILDVVLAPSSPFPLDLLDVVRRALDRGPPSYASRVLRPRGEDLLRRIAVVLPRPFGGDWWRHVAARVPVFLDQPLAAAAARCETLGTTAPAARVVGLEAPDFARAARLLSAADPDAVAFANRRLEVAWVESVLGLGER